MVTPELRLIRYFVAVAREENVTRAAAALHISQPSLSAAIKQLEGQLGVELLSRRGRRIATTPAGDLLLARGTQLLAHAESVAEEVRDQGSASGQVYLGLSPTARYGVAPTLLAECTARVPSVMIYTSEATTGALLRGVAGGRFDLAVTFCAGSSTVPGVELSLLRNEPAVVHLPADHALAKRPQLTLAELAEETILVAASSDSSGFSSRILAAFAEQGIAPRTQADPYPDLGIRAVRENLGVVIYARSAFPPQLAGSAFVPLEPALSLPFHLAVREGSRSAALEVIQEVGAAMASVAAA
jgi:DNA-binding transcriptional LysR family regulator